VGADKLVGWICLIALGVIIGQWSVASDPMIDCKPVEKKMSLDMSKKVQRNWIAYWKSQS